ncbi:hypothetical protein VNO78_11433 [Psophocarpus tetragonolobus]|uniref:Leucine-rich repeat-containing N-terminal plant-type domain-containing protein n=1 Tax=Psophocarpus tetragonolobus TaxID=3891 RepID=A0AAN9SN60_PSOTE
MSCVSIFILLLIVPSFIPALSEQCNPQEKRTLLQIKKELGNPANLSSWLPTIHCCDGTWIGVECGTVKTKAYRVNHLALSELISPNPAPFPPLSATFLIFAHHLRRQHTNVSGHIPDFLSHIKTLEYLMISNSKVSGTLPAWVPSLPNLAGISFDGNQLTGTIPDSFGSFPNAFVVLTLSRNRLTGKIPSMLANLDLLTVNLSENMLEGDASILFGKHTRNIYL